MIDLKDQTIFREAVALAEKGQTKEAYPQFDQLAQRYPNETDVLIWLAYTSPDLLKAIKAIRAAISLDSYNPNLTMARSWLETEVDQQSHLDAAQALDDMPTQIFYWKGLF